MCKIGFDIVAIKSYIIDELENNKEFLFNELDLQMFVARALDKKFPRRKYTIHLEYHLPQGWNKTFHDKYTKIWGTEKPYFDIVIEQKDPNKFIVIELKYKLKKIEIQSDSFSYRRFGEQPMNTDVQLVTDQSASNEGRYDFWKDVKRLEVLNNSFSKVVGGIAILVTNDHNYTKTNDGYKYSRYGLEDSDKEKNGLMYWNHNAPNCKPLCNQSNIRCGDQKYCNCCGEHLKDGIGEYSPKDISIYKRPNFLLEGKYRGEWFNGRDKKTGGFINEELKQRYYCYSVLVSNNDK